MIIKKEDYIMDVDIEQTKKYYKSHSLCDCPSCRNYYVQVKDNFPLLNNFLLELGVDIERPDELGHVELENEIEYLCAAYTVCGKILEFDKCEIDLFEDRGVVSIVFNNSYIPNEQQTDYFVVTVYNIRLPRMLNEPFPETAPKKIRKVNVIQLIASICLLFVSVANLLNLIMEIPFWLHVCTGPISLITVILFSIVFCRQIKSKKKDKNSKNK